VGAVLGSISLGAWLAACGLDEIGSLDGNDASLNDVQYADTPVKEVNPEANPPPLTCQEAGTPLDASCLGKPVPTGWQPIAVQVGANLSCGDGGFVSTPLLTSPVLPAGACNCTGCGATGQWSCGATLWAGSTCTQDKFDASASACWVIDHSSLSETLTRTGNPICGGGQQTGFQDAQATAITTCTPQSCDTDFCALGNQGYTLCIYNSAVTDGGCPTDFPAGRVVGPSTSVSCALCQQCALTNADAGCTGTATGYANNDCTGGVVTVATNNGQCQNPSGNFASVFYDAGVPVANCGPATGPNTGKVALDQPSTICCLQ